MSKIAVVGFGRIGRSAVKAGLGSKLFTPSVIVDIATAEAMAPLFEFDTNYGRWRDPVHVEDDGLVIGDAAITWIDARDGARSGHDHGSAGRSCNPASPVSHLPALGRLLAEAE